MDATVNDFLKEINQISSKADTKGQSEVWQECFDEVTGYSYFWNTETDDVTWVPPKSYKPAEHGPKKVNGPAKPMGIEKDKKKPELFVPPTAVTTPQYSTSDVKPEAKIKVYSIQDAIIKKPDVSKQQKVFSVQSSSKQPLIKKASLQRVEDFDDEKIELITEYGGDSDSELDEESHSRAAKTKQTVSPLRKQSPVRTATSPLGSSVRVSEKGAANDMDNDDDEEEDDDDIDLLATIQQRAQELKKLGGEVPAAVKDIIHNTNPTDKSEKPKTVSAVSLVAGYNSESSDDDEETMPPKPVFPIAPPPKPTLEVAHSTLFPITQPIDVKDFIVSEATCSETVSAADSSVSSNDYDNKPFQRKRRIGVSLINNVKRPKDDIKNPSSDFAGFGFKSDVSNEPKLDREEASSMYPGFQKGGVMFVKSDASKSGCSNEEASESEDKSANRKETEDDYTVLKEKLLFLGEGREPVLPVQVMLIQAETLFLAMNEGGLKFEYLYKWLKEMCSELIKLEREAAPEGWLLQWDRSHKRYFYQNQTTGVSQWRYPEPDVTRCDDAMDISTTPPPSDIPDDGHHLLVKNPGSPVTYGPHLPTEPPCPPSPPKIRSPTPPPPPVISRDIPKRCLSDVHLPPEDLQKQDQPLPPAENGQPLPPGVDLVSNEPESAARDTLSTALDSFYSEIAEVTENRNSPTLPSPALDMAETQTQQIPEVVKKKKKKVKLAQGLTMKKKGVSQLVEKWKNVHKNYD